MEARSDSAETLGPWRLARPHAPEEILHIVWTEDGPGARLRFRGELDLDGVAIAGLALSEAVQAERDGGPVTLDLRDLAFCDSSGLHLLLMTARQARTDGRRLVVVPSDAVLRLMRLTETEGEFEIGGP